VSAAAVPDWHRRFVTMTSAHSLMRDWTVCRHFVSYDARCTGTVTLLSDGPCWCWQCQGRKPAYTVVFNG
jgi:hypothetical protein